MILILYCQILVGLVQPFACLIRLAFSKGKHPDYRKNLLMYALLVVVYFIPIVIAANMSYTLLSNIPEWLITLYLFIIPWIIATYYYYIVYKRYPTVRQQEFVEPIT